MSPSDAQLAAWREIVASRNLRSPVDEDATDDVLELMRNAFAAGVAAGRKAAHDAYFGVKTYRIGGTKDA